MTNTRTSKEKENNCCPEFDPKPWDDRMLEWDKKRFIKRKVRTFFYIPLNFSAVMKQLDRKLTQSGVTIPDGLSLSDHTSKWNMDIYIAVDKEVEKEWHVEFKGKYYCKVYEGPYKDTGKWCQDYEARAVAKKLAIIKWFMWYTTCPECARKYGKNPVVIICQVEPANDYHGVFTEIVQIGRAHV